MSASQQTMILYRPLARRQLLIGAAAALAAPPLLILAQPQAGRFAVNVASNQAADNAALQQLMLDRGLFGRLSLDAQIVESRTVSGPMEALLAGDADVCMVSAFAGVLPAIEQGKALRLIGAAMQLPALAVYARDSGPQRIEDLVGKTVGVGPTNGLLHILMIALLRKKGIDPPTVTFVNSGSNAQVLAAVADGKVDAGLSGVGGMRSAKARVLKGGRLWAELPEYTYQTAYASVRALKEKPEALARCLAAYTQLYRYLSSPDSKVAYLDARRKTSVDGDQAEGEAFWDFVQKHQPYAVNVGLSPKRIAYLQQLNISVGLQTSALPFDQMVDLAPAEAARRFLTWD